MSYFGNLYRHCLGCEHCSYYDLRWSDTAIDERGKVCQDGAWLMKVCLSSMRTGQPDYKKIGPRPRQGIL